LSALTDIRTSRLGDATRFGEVLALAHEAFGGVEPPSGVLTETVADIEQRFKAGPILIAQAGDELVGSLFCAAKDDLLYLTRLATRPAWRRRGVGRALMAAAEAQTRAIGAKKMLLRVRITLPDNRRYFERLGFVVTGQGQEGGRTPFFTMERRLGG
jgi:GNAT superfamily N-acetyltransferase